MRGLEHSINHGKKCGLTAVFLSFCLFASAHGLVGPSITIPSFELPGDVTMNQDAGREMWLFVTLRLCNGERLPFFLDTGTTRTLLDSSLDSQLGKPIGPGTAHHFGEQLAFVRYAAPPLFLGDTRLQTGSDVYTCDLKHLSVLAGRPVMGILGMDCLKHYCLQLDFQAGRIHFLNPNQVAVAPQAKAFPLMFYQDCPFIHHKSLAGGFGARSLIDTGCTEDGMVETTYGSTCASDTLSLPSCVWEGEIHTNLSVSLNDNVPLGKDSSILGLRFLARHLVTFNFPKRMLFLQQTSIGPLVDHDLDAAVDFLHALRAQGRQPGWSKDDNGGFSWPETADNSFTFHIVKNGDTSIYHYVVGRASKNDSWKLLRAWRTDQNGHTIEEYVVS